jgi:hypothetical protein
MRAEFGGDGLEAGFAEFAAGARDICVGRNWAKSPLTRRGAHVNVCYSPMRPYAALNDALGKSAVRWFLLGIMVAWTPSLLALA